VGYKRIRSAIHNFAHSFLSSMNYVDDEHVIDVIRSLLPRQQGGELRFRFPEGEIEPLGDYPGPLKKSVEQYAVRLPSHLREEGVDPQLVADLVILTSIGGRGPRYRVEATDDRGKRHRVEVIPG
jgi:hypothetical protein